MTGGRKSIEVTITAEGRDKGKKFRLTEMSARRAEKWAMRAITAIGRSGIEVPDEAADLGMAAIAKISLRALVGVEFEAAEPLMDEMLGCVQIVMPSGVVRELIDEDIDEVGTLLQLRGEVIGLHVGFSLADVLSKLRSSLTSADPISSQPPTSPGTLPP